MKKKLLSIMLMLVMVLSLAACGKKETKNTAQNVLEQLSKAEANTVTCEFSMTMDEELMSFRVTGANQDEMNGYATIEMKMVMEPYAMEEYVELTNMYVVNGEEIYIDIQQVIDFLVELDSQFAMLSTYLELPGEYLKITMDDLIDLYAQMGIDMSAMDLESMANAETNEAYAQAMVEVFGKMFDEYASKAGESAVTITANKVTFKINNDNIVAVMDALAAMDVENYFIDLAERIDKIDGTLGNTAMMQEEVEGWNDSIKEAAADLKENGVGDEKVDMTVDFGMNGKNVEMSMNMDVEDEEEKVNVNMSMVMTPEKASGVAVPESVMTLEEAMALLAELGVM